MGDRLISTVVAVMCGMVLGWLAPVALSAAIILVLLSWYMTESETWMPDPMEGYGTVVRQMMREW